MRVEIMFGSTTKAYAEFTSECDKVKGATVAANIAIFKKMPRKLYAYGYARSEYTCRCSCGVRFFGKKRDSTCPLCRYKAKS